MKYRFAILAALFFATPLTAQTIGARVGMTLSSFAASDEGGGEISSITGIHIGATASFMGDRLVLSAAYSQRGTGLTGIDFVEGLDFQFNLAYVDVGAFAKLPLGAGPYLLVGPTLGLRVACSASLSAEGNELSSECGADEEDPFKTYDFGVLGGAGISFGLGGYDVVVEGLYSFGILNISDFPDDSVKNRGFILRAGVDLMR